MDDDYNSQIILTFINVICIINEGLFVKGLAPITKKINCFV